MTASAQEERAARAAWTVLAEAPDPAASALVSMLGAQQALEWLRLGEENLTAAASTLHERCEREVAIGIVSSHARWQRRWEQADVPLLERAERIGARVIVPGDDEWPSGLDDLGRRSPLALWVRGAGNVARLWHRSVAVVGARASTSYGEHVTAELSAGVSDAGWIVISGGAYGIDGVAHRAAMAAGKPTVAVMAGGVDRLYPAGHEELLGLVMEEGCVIAEAPPGFAPHRSRFLARNRLIATASATVVVEAAARSGALNTAHHAAEIARPVGAVPGPVTSASSAGSHALIREGVAVLVTTARDVIELAAPLTESITLDLEGAGDGGAATVARDDDRASRQVRPEFEAPHHRAAFDALSRRARNIADVAMAAGIELSAARAALAALEIAGLAIHEDGGWKKVPAPLSAQYRVKTP